MSFDVSDNFRLLRKEKGITQSQMAEIGGVSLATQQNYESQRTTPTLEYLQKLAAVGIDVNYLLTGRRSAETLNTEESELLTAYRQASIELKYAAYMTLKAGQAIKENKTQNIGDNNDNRTIQHDNNIGDINGATIGYIHQSKTNK